MADGGDSSGTADVLALYGFGYACMVRGIAYLAIRPLARALELAPDAVSGVTVAATRQGLTGEFSWINLVQSRFMRDTHELP